MATIIILAVLALTSIGFATLWLTGTHGKASAAAAAKVKATGAKGVGVAGRVAANRDRLVRLGYAVMGPVALCTLSLSYIEVLPLHIGLVALVLPAYSAMLIMGLLSRDWGKRAMIGFTAGFLATVVYDLARLFLAYGNDGTDPIGHIGEHLIGEGAPAYVGYIWRLAGNGAGLGILYAMLPDRWLNVRGGLVYGTLVGMGMLSVLYFFPVAQTHLFYLNKATVVNGFIGHWAYGATLGFLVQLALTRHLPGRKAIPLPASSGTEKTE